MIIPGKTVVIPGKTQVIPGITQQKQGFLLQKRQHRQGWAKKYRATNTHIAQGLSCRKKSLYSENKHNRAEGERSDPPELISRKQEDYRHRTETPQHTNNFENETLLDGFQNGTGKGRGGSYAAVFRLTFYKISADIFRFSKTYKP